MPWHVPERAEIAELVATVRGFHLTDRAILRAQKSIEEALALGTPTPAQSSAYLRVVRSYFERFARDAQAQLRSVDRELERLYQRQYNLSAERGVAAKRVDAVASVLARTAELDGA
jgi:hypothetical protein